MTKSLILIALFFSITINGYSELTLYGEDVPPRTVKYRCARGHIWTERQTNMLSSGDTVLWTDDQIYFCVDGGDCILLCQRCMQEFAKTHFGEVEKIEIDEINENAARKPEGLPHPTHEEQ